MSCPCCNGKLLPYLDGQKCSVCRHFLRARSEDYSRKLERNPDENLLQKKISLRLKDILPLLHAGDRVLEIGCAEGALGKKIKEQVAVIYEGLELSPDRNAAQLVLDSVTNKSEELPLQAYQGILSFHVLEHIENLREEMASWKKLLNDNESSFVVVEVPHASGNSLLSHDMNPEHIHQFTVSSLTILLESSGFRVDSISTGHFESPLYCDSIRAICRLAVNAEKTKEKLLSRFRSAFPEGFFIWGVGGDFRNYILPILPELNVLGIVDTNKDLHGKVFAGHVVTGFENDFSAHRFLISSFRFKKEIRAQLLSLKVDPSKIRSIDEFYCS